MGMVNVTDPELTKNSEDAGPPNPQGGTGGSKLGCFSAIYGAGVLFTIVWYSIAMFDGCDARTLRGRCVDFSIFEILVYALIWPLHWLFELLEALGV
jgi:hypothetical protein